MTTAPAVDPIVHDTATLIEALDTECRLLSELAAILRKQREGVTADDLQIVDDSVFGAHRVMATLREAQRRRRMLIELLTGTDTTSLVDLDDSLGDSGPALAEVRARVGREARTLAREIRINRTVLDGAMEHGNHMIMMLRGASSENDLQGAGSGGPGVLIDQRV